MVKLPDVPQVLRIVLRYSYGTDLTVINRFYVKYAGSVPDNTGLTTYAGNFGASWNVNMAPMCTTAVSLIGVTVTDLSSTAGAQGVNSATHPGTRTGGVLTAGTSAMLHFHLQRRYRGGKPRIYLPCGSGTDLQSAQVWQPAFTSALFTAWQTFQAGSAPPAGTTISSQVNVSYYEGFKVHEGSTGRMSNISLVRPTPVVDVITSTSVDPRVASQRRRNRP